MDALANLLDGPRGRGAFVLRTLFEPPWAVTLADGAPLGLVAVLVGEAWLVPENAEPQRMPAGALALVRRGRPVTLADDPGRAPQVVFGPGGRLTTPTGDDLSDTLRLGPHAWGTDPYASTELLLGCYQLRGEVSRRVLDALPAHLVLAPGTWSSPLVALLREEILAEAPGQQAVVDRLFDLLLAVVVRAWFDQPDTAAPGWYRAHQDPVVGRALRLLHEQPARPWTVARLAAESSTSRSVLARAFTDLVGLPPMTYLREWRLARAADLLLDPDLTIDVVARRVGYSDGSTLSTLFKASRGLSPRQFQTASNVDQETRPRVLGESSA